MSDMFAASLYSCHPLLSCIHLRGFSFAQLITPECGDIKVLCVRTDVLAEEQAHEAIFQPLPFHYIEVAHLLLRHAKDAFEEADDVLYQVSWCIALQSTFA